MGRGLKTIREVPIAKEARKLALPLHQINTFTKWQPPKSQGEPINLIIAVSFGLFIPPRLLEGAKYGGLNVHPSMLPDFRGAAPIHHTLLAGCTRTGVSLQTLHPEYFDHGAVLAQTPQPGIEIPRPSEITVPELTKLLASKGADMLVQGVRDRLHVPPLQTIEQPLIDENAALIRPAPSIEPEDRRIDWKTWSCETILRKERVLGPLWNIAATNPSTPNLKRIIWSLGFRKVSDYKESMSPGIPTTNTNMTKNESGTSVFLPAGTNDGCLYIGTMDGKILRAEVAKVEGQRTGPAVDAALKAGLIGNHSAETQFPKFWQKLM